MLARRLAVLACACVFLAAGPAVLADVITYGPAISIADLNASTGSITVGDKVFSNFSVSSVGPGAPLAGDIFLTGASINGVYGLYFQAPWIAGAGQSIDTLLRFKVTVAGPHSISAVGMKMTAVDAHNGGMVAISENIWPDVPELSQDTLGDLSVFYNSSSGTKRLYDETVLSQPVHELWVVKDIALSGRTGDATLSQFYQTFTQVPEPATLGLLALGGALLAARRRK